MGRCRRLVAHDGIESGPWPGEEGRPGEPSGMTEGASNTSRILPLERERREGLLQERRSFDDDAVPHDGVVRVSRDVEHAEPGVHLA